MIFVTVNVKVVPTSGGESTYTQITNQRAKKKKLKKTTFHVLVERTQVQFHKNKHEYSLLGQKYFIETHCKELSNNEAKS